jgi:Skp family chaperone for outer membrane proteins
MIMNGQIACRMRSREVIAAGLLAMLTLPCWSRAQSSDRPDTGDKIGTSAEIKAEQNLLTGQEAASKPIPLQVPVAIGTVDMDRIFERYKKVKEIADREGVDRDVMRAKLALIFVDVQQESGLLSKLAPGTDEYRQHENRLRELKARYDREREQAEQDFARRESRHLVSIYREIQEAITSVAKARGLTYVVKTTPEPTLESDPNSVMTAIARSVVYADPRADITDEVVRVLNQRAKSPSITKPAGN